VTTVAEAVARTAGTAGTGGAGGVGAGGGTTAGVTPGEATGGAGAGAGAGVGAGGGVGLGVGTGGAGVGGATGLGFAAGFAAGVVATFGACGAIRAITAGCSTTSTACGAGAAARGAAALGAGAETVTWTVARAWALGVRWTIRGRGRTSGGAASTCLGAERSGSWAPTGTLWSGPSRRPGRRAMPPRTTTNSAPAAVCVHENLMLSPDLTDNDY
jgi:hypothetical protein